MFGRILFVVTICWSFKFQTNDWQLKKSANNIVVYTKQDLQTGISEVKVTTNFNAKLSSLVSFIKDISAHKDYIYRCKESFIYKNINDSELYYYHETETPWPVSNRYGIIRYKITQNRKTKIVNIVAHDVQGLYPYQANKVEVPKLKASWVFTPKSDGTVDGAYYLFLNPGGNVPIWLMNLFVVDGPYNTIEKMKELLKNKKYTTTNSSFIVD